MAHEDFRAKWLKEATVFRRRHALVDAATLCDEILGDFEAVDVVEMEAVLNLRQAAIESGYSADHLGSLVRKGEIPNAGRPNAPKIRRQDIPLRPSRVRHAASHGTSGSTTPVQIARFIVGRMK